MGSPAETDLRRVGLLYDERMCSHATPDGEPHPENPERIRAIWRKLVAERITGRCVVLKAKEAEDNYIASVHTKSHIKLIKTISSTEFDSTRRRIASKFNSIYLNQGSSESAYLAAGSVIEVAEKVANGDLSSGIAVVRPPGHHAESDEAMGFCLFNNVAIAANFLLNDRPELGIKKILIVDWDVHHGNGTQHMFYKDPRVLFFSVHRFDFGSFYPAGGDGAYCMIGDGPGAGYNINVPWEHGLCGDADYVAVWDHLLIPVAQTYNPDIILVSAGFDAALGDPLGGCCITPFGYSLMLKKLMPFAQGKIVMALEGGYNLNSIANSVLACAKTLLDGKPLVGSVDAHPFESTWRVIQNVRNELKRFWPVLDVELPKTMVTTNAKPYQICFAQMNMHLSSDSEAENDEGASSTIGSVNVAEIVDDVIQPLSSLNIKEDDDGKPISLNHLSNEQSPGVSSEVCHPVQSASDQVIGSSVPWRSNLSTIHIWYGTYGSNMWKPRFRCYIEGGKVDGMNAVCHGSKDKSFPKDVIWKTVPHRLFFGRSYTRTWGAGGVAFLHPESNINDKTYLCMYKITLEQFNDVLLQENQPGQQMESPLLDIEDLDSVAKCKSMSLETLKDAWYSNVVYLGCEDGLPVLTMTCPLSHVEQLKSGEIPSCWPPKEYMETLVKGLVEGEQLSREDAIHYINNAAARKL